MNRLYIYIAAVFVALLAALLVSCFHNPSSSDTLRVSGKQRVYQDGDYVKYKVTGLLSYPLLDASNKPVISLGDSNCPSALVQFGQPCILSQTLEQTDNLGNVLLPADLEVTWSAYTQSGGVLNSGVTGSPNVPGVMLETWTLTPSNPNIPGSFRTTRYVTQIQGGDIEGQTVLHAYATPGSAGSSPTPVYFINRSNQSLSEVGNVLIEDSPLALDATTNFQFRLLNNCTSTGCTDLALTDVFVRVGDIFDKTYDSFRSQPTQVIEVTKNYDTILTGASANGGIVATLPADTSNPLGVSPFTQCDSLRLMTGANPLPQVEAFNTGSVYLFPQVGALEINNSCRLAQVVDFPTGVLKLLSASGSYDPEGQPLSYTWTVTPATTNNYLVLGANNVVAGFYAYSPDKYDVRLSASDGVNVVRDRMLIEVFNSVNDYQNLPVAFANQNLISVPDINVTLDASLSVGSNLTYSWIVTSTPNINSPYIFADSSAKQTTFSASDEGEYEIELTVTDANGMQSQDWVYVYIRPVQTPTNLRPVLLANSLYRYYPVNGSSQAQIIFSDLKMNAIFDDTNIPVDGR